MGGTTVTGTTPGVGGTGAAGLTASPIVGVKIYEHSGSYQALVDEWAALGVNAVFAPEAMLRHDELRNAARAAGIRTFLIYPVFYNPDALAADDSLWAIKHDGSRAQEEWVQFVCPAHEGYRAQRVRELQGALALDPDGLSLDFIRHFVFWEKVYPDTDPASLPRTSYSAAALARFERDTGIDVPYDTASQAAAWIDQNHAGEWQSWRTGLITSMAAELAAEARRLKPQIIINVHLVPWRQADFDGARLRIAGQDVAALGQHADLLSPMTYHHMLRREPVWVSSVVAEMAARGQKPVVPSIQVARAYLSEELSTDAFAQALEEALKPPSAGVVFWNWENLSQSTEKQQVVAAHRP